MITVKLRDVKLEKTLSGKGPDVFYWPLTSISGEKIVGFSRGTDRIAVSISLDFC